MSPFMTFSHRLSVIFVGMSIFALVGCSSSAFRNLSFLNGSGGDDISAIGEQSASGGLTIWHDSFEVAQQKSRETGKPILVDFTGSDWCGWCIKLKKHVFETAEFETWAHENVVLLELDFPHHSRQNAAIKAQNERLQEKYKVSGFPTVLILSPDGHVQAKMGYEKDPHQWIGSLESKLANRPSSTDFK